MVRGGIIQDPLSELLDSDNDSERDQESFLLRLFIRVQQEKGLGPSEPASQPTLTPEEAFLKVASAWIKQNRADRHPSCTDSPAGMTIIAHKGNGRFAVTEQVPEQWQQDDENYLLQALTDRITLHGVPDTLIYCWDERRMSRETDGWHPWPFISNNRSTTQEERSSFLAT